MSQTIVITGANRGIGLSLCQHYCQRGDKVFAACRSSSPELMATGATIITDIDVANPEAAAALVDSLKEQAIDLLINNAGVLRNEVLGDIDFNSIDYQMQINAYGPLRITEALKDQLASPAKVMMVTSRMGSIADNTSGGRYGYRMSKAALNMAATSLAHDLKPQGVAVGIVHPGLVGTEMIGGHGDITPDEAAIRIARRIEELSLDNSGAFWHSNGERLPW